MLQCGHVRVRQAAHPLAWSLAGPLSNFKRKSIFAAVVQGIVALVTFGVHFEEAYGKWARESKDKKLYWTIAFYGRSRHRLKDPSEVCPCCSFWSFAAERPEITHEHGKWLGKHGPAVFQSTAMYFSTSGVARFTHAAYHLKSRNASPCLQFWPEDPVVTAESLYE